jgi:hypothetical protein
MSAVAEAQIAIAAPVAANAIDGLLSQDFLLIAACCSWPPNEARKAIISCAGKRFADWDHFLQVARRHRIVALVGEALRWAESVLPRHICDELEWLIQRNVHHSLNLAAETVRIQNMLDAAAIPVVILKGAAIEQLAYGSLASKQTRDINLLVPPECAAAAMQILERGGYALSLPAKNLNAMQRHALIRHGREIELFQLEKRLRLELQWRAADNPLLLKGITAHSPTQYVALSETVGLRTLSSDDLFAYLCVHGARHSWSRLKWLADLNALIRSTTADIEHLYRHAQKIGAGLCAAQGLLLCHRLLGLKLPAALVDELQANKRHQKLVAIAMRAMTAPSTGSDRDPGIRGVLCELRNRFLLGQGLRFYMTECRLALVSSADIVRLPLPRPLHFIYPLVRLPMWLWRRFKFAWAPALRRAG